MKVKDRTFKALLALETVLLVGIVAGIASLGLERAEAWRLFEFLGADMAAMITTYGLYKMRDIT
jgi:hypothetical protein